MLLHVLVLDGTVADWNQEATVNRVWLADRLGLHEAEITREFVDVGVLFLYVGRARQVWRRS